MFDRDGNLFVTYSGSRGQEAPVSIFRVTPAGTREPFVSGIVNATSMAFGPDGALYVSSRFEGAVYRVDDDGTHEQVASDLGVACGLAFDADGWMYVGDRSGTIFRVRDGTATAVCDAAAERGGVPPGDEPGRRAVRHAPTLGSYDHVYRIDRRRRGAARCRRRSAGRRGWRSRPTASLHVVDALAGGERRVPVRRSRTPSRSWSCPAARWSAWPSARRASWSWRRNDTAYRFDVMAGDSDDAHAGLFARKPIADLRAAGRRRTR